MPLLLALTIALLGPTADPAKADLDALQGTWRIASMESDGEERDLAEIKHFTSEYGGNHLTLRAGKEVRRQGIITLDPSRTPKAINTWDQDGPFADQTIPGIYEIQGETLRLCFARPGEPRPTAFTTKDGKAFLSCVYKKVKP